MFAIVNNVSRNDTYGKVTDLLALAHAIACHGWSETSVILVNKDKATLDHAKHILLMMLADLPDKAKVTIGDKEYTKSDLVAKVEAWEDAGQYPIVVAGNRRALAILLLAILGIRVKANSKVTQQDATEANITENVAHDYALRLDRQSKLASVRALHDAGQVKAEADIAKLGFKRGMAQWLWQALRLTLQGEDERTILAGNKEALRKLADASPDEKEAARAKVKTDTQVKTLARKHIETAHKALPDGFTKDCLSAILADSQLTLEALVAKANKAE